MDDCLAFFLRYFNLWRPAALIAVAEFDFATLIGNGSKSCQELATLTGVSEDWVYRLLKSLSVDGIFAEAEAERDFLNTDFSNLLRSDIPGSARSMILLWKSHYFRDGFAHLTQIARTGLSWSQLVDRPPFYVHLQEREAAEENRLFEDAIANLADMANETIAQRIALPSEAHVVDVGGGQGNLLRAIQRHHFIRKATLFDTPEVIEQVKARGASSLELVAGNLLNDPLPEAEIYIYRDVYHCFDDQTCISIAANCRRSMPPTARMLIIEQPFDTPALVAGIDLVMGVVFGGRQRSDRDWKNLFPDFQLTRRFLTESPFIIWEFSPNSGIS